MILTAQQRLRQAGDPVKVLSRGAQHRRPARPASAPPARNVPVPERSQELDRHGLLLMHLPQVRLVAKGIWDRMRFAVELDDLIGYGTIGLMHAVERFDPTRGILLKTYAEHRIRGAILDGLRGMDWLPRSARQRERRKRLQYSVNAAPGDAHESRTTVVSGRTVTASVPGTDSRPRPHPSLCMESVFPGGNLGDLEKLAESTAAGHALNGGGVNPERLYERKERSDRLTAAVARLPLRHRQILDYYYRQEMSMRQIGAILKVHESRVSQLHGAALARLRKELSPQQASPRACRKPPQRYSGRLADLDSSNRLTAVQSSSVSTPMVS